MNNVMNINEHSAKEFSTHRIDDRHKPTYCMGLQPRILRKRKLNTSPMFTNVHEILGHVHEMFIIYALKTDCPQNNSFVA